MKIAIPNFIPMGEAMNTRVFLIRHGRTAWNKDVRFRGRTDLPLDEVGFAQAEAIAARLKDSPIVAVYSSPLRRAIQTAEPLARALGLEVSKDEGFIDINFGEWQGLSPQEVAQLYPGLYRQWLESPHLVRIPGGEGLEDVRSRAMKALKQAIERHQGQQIAIVGHQVVNRVLLCAVLGLSNASFWRIGQDNGCINIFEYDGENFNILLLNDTCHLE
ncbi:MAG: histidine phosphatase family protein [Candidatus Thorarchaeota archaeon]|nr:MAG: histidine phosphatase family protein [Candidatus Thorarchaeota archaeon]